MLTEGMPERKECNSTGTQRCRCTAVTTNVFQHWNGCVDNVDLWLSTLAVPKIGTPSMLVTVMVTLTVVALNFQY